MRRVLFKAKLVPFVCFGMLLWAGPLTAQAASLGSAAGFAVLASKAVTCTGPNSNVTGPVGVTSAATAITRTGCTMNVQVAPGAYSAFQTAWTTGLGACSHTLASTLPGVTTLPSGTYCTPAALTLTTATLNLTGSGPWNFEIGTPGVAGTGALTATGLHVISSNPCNVFWWVRQDVTLTTSAFQGTILGGGDITLTDTTLTGRAWATGAVTLTRSPILGCTAAGTVPGTKCATNGGSDEDKNSDQSKDTENSNKSESSNNGNDQQGNHDEDCKSGDSDKDTSDKHDSNKDNSKRSGD
jgi:ice-binding like protein